MAQLARGARLVELLKQPQYTPFPMTHEVVSVWAGTTGQLDDVPVEDIGRFESEFLLLGRARASGILDSIAETRDLTDETVADLESAVSVFKSQFLTSKGHSLLGHEATAPALDEAEVAHETIKRIVPAHS